MARFRLSRAGRYLPTCRPTSKPTRCRLVWALAQHHLSSPPGAPVLYHIQAAKTGMEDLISAAPVAEETPASRRDCTRCRRPQSVCLCPALPDAPLAIQGAVVVLQHPHELKKRLATVPLLPLALGSCKVVVGRAFKEGMDSEVDALLGYAASGQCPFYILFPGPQAACLTDICSQARHRQALQQANLCQASTHHLRSSVSVGPSSPSTCSQSCHSVTDHHTPSANDQSTPSVASDQSATSVYDHISLTKHDYASLASASNCNLAHSHLSSTQHQSHPAANMHEGMQQNCTLYPLEPGHKIATNHVAEQQPQQQQHSQHQTGPDYPDAEPFHTHRQQPIQHRHASNQTVGMHSSMHIIGNGESSQSLASNQSIASTHSRSAPSTALGHLGSSICSASQPQQQPQPADGLQTADDCNSCTSANAGQPAPQWQGSNTESLPAAAVHEIENNMPATKPAYVLLVVDGTWRQAKEMFMGVAAQYLPPAGRAVQVSLPMTGAVQDATPNQNTDVEAGDSQTVDKVCLIKKEPMEGYMLTYEAVSRAVAMLELQPDLLAPLLAPLRLMTEHQAAFDPAVKARMSGAKEANPRKARYTPPVITSLQAVT